MGTTLTIVVLQSVGGGLNMLFFKIMCTVVIVDSGSSIWLSLLEFHTSPEKHNDPMLHDLSCGVVSVTSLLIYCYFVWLEEF